MTNYEQSILAEFDGYSAALLGEEHSPFQKVAVSIFADWLGAENLSQLDCHSLEEREERNRKLLDLCAKCYDSTVIYTLHRDPSEPDKLTKVTNRETFLAKCAWSGEKTSQDFFVLFLPEFGAIYQESWDDTNILWYREENLIGPLLSLVYECGLHILRYAI